MIDQIVDYTTRISLELQVKGAVNIQFVVSKGKLYIIEVNPRSSRTVPFLSKVTHFPIVEVATRIALGETLKDMGYGSGLLPAKATSPPKRLYSPSARSAWRKSPSGRK